MSQRNKCFVIPGGFVPYNDTVTLLTYKRLRKLDYDYDVFAFKGKEDETIKEELQNDPMWNKFSIKYMCDYDDAIAIKHPFRMFKSLHLMNKYVRESINEFEKNKYDLLYTSSIPGISHICGYKIKKKYPNVKWVASFSDPIKNAPYKKDPDLKYRNIFYRIAFHVGSFIYMNNKYEKVAIDNADELVFICDEQRDFTLSQYKNGKEIMDKCVVEELTYIPEWNIYKQLLNNTLINNTPKIAVHLGRIYGLRRIDTFLQALKELKDEDKDLCKKIVFNQYSEIQPHSLKYINDNNIDDVFIIHNKVTYNESMEIMKNADILVLFDTIVDKDTQPYLPSKIIEYQLLNKPVLSICKKNSPSYRIFKGNNCAYDVEDIKKIIKGLI